MSELENMDINEHRVSFRDTWTSLLIYYTHTHTHTHTHTLAHTHIYIYIYIYICIFMQHFFVNANFIKHNRHFMPTYFLLDPFEFPYYFYRIRGELI